MTYLSRADCRYLTLSPSTRSVTFCMSTPLITRSLQTAPRPTQFPGCSVSNRAKRLTYRTHARVESD
jgi:hypothetical protein